MREARRRSLDQAAADYEAAAEALVAARKALIEQIRAAHAEKARPSDILRAARRVWTREYVRRLLADADDQREPDERDR